MRPSMLIAGKGLPQGQRPALPSRGMGLTGGQLVRSEDRAFGLDGELKTCPDRRMVASGFEQ